MTVPQANYVIDSEGKKISVQLNVQEWEAFVREFHAMERLLGFKHKLKNAFREVRQIQKGEKQATTLQAFLDEL